VQVVVASRDPNASFRRVRVIGLTVIIGLVVFVTVVDAIDGLFFGDRYHVDFTFYTFLLGFATILLTGEALKEAVTRKDRSDNGNGNGNHDAAA
jgi:hypothetical protein